MICAFALDTRHGSTPYHVVFASENKTVHGIETRWHDSYKPPRCLFCKHFCLRCSLLYLQTMRGEPDPFFGRVFVVVLL